MKNLLIPIMALLLVTSVFAAQGDADGTCSKLVAISPSHIGEHESIFRVFQFEFGMFYI